MTATNTNVNDHVRCIKAFERILAGQNQYYKERLQDPDFVMMVMLAVEAEKMELDKLIS